jgi:hypothetical protein
VLSALCDARHIFSLKCKHLDKNHASHLHPHLESLYAGLRKKHRLCKPKKHVLKSMRRVFVVSLKSSAVDVKCNRCMKALSMKGFIKGLWQFCRFLFVPQWGKPKSEV